MTVEKSPELGSLRDRVQVQRRDMAGEPEGGHRIVYMPVAIVWARVRTLTARLDAVADGRGVAITHTVVMRYRTDVQPGDRLVCRGVGMAVVSAGDMNGRRAYLSCRCTQTSITG